MENRIRPIWVIILLLLGILIGLYINKGVAKKIQVEGGTKFDEVMWYVDNDYVEKPDAQKLQDEAIAALMEELDPHSDYISLDDFNEVNDPLLGSFDGIGVQFRLEKDTVAIVNVIKGGPSEKVGLLAGDRIVYVDDTLMANKKLKNEDVMRKLKGPKGTKVRVRILRRGVDGLLDYTITRDAIPTYSVDIAYMLDEKTGYLKLSKFSATTVSEFKNAVINLEAQGMKQLIFDLRGKVCWKRCQWWCLLMVSRPVRAKSLLELCRTTTVVPSSGAVHSARVWCKNKSCSATSRPFVSPWPAITRLRVDASKSPTAAIRRNTCLNPTTATKTVSFSIPTASISPIR